MRAITRLAWVVLLCGAAATVGLAETGAPPEKLAAFAQGLALADVAGFVQTVGTLRRSGRLPAWYVTKDDARAHGWQGGGLCAVWPGHLIGGDRFYESGTRLPHRPGRSYHEADLDSDCLSRGPKRLIFSNDGLIFVTTDHYTTLTPVP